MKIIVDYFNRFLKSFQDFSHFYDVARTICQFLNIRKGFLKLLEASGS